MKRRELMLPKLRMEANLDASTLDVDKRTVEVRWYSGAKVQRFSLFDGPYELTFAMQSKNVRLGRLNSGAPLKAGHAFHGDIDSVIGVIEKAWLTNGEGRATVRFSSRDEVQPILMDVKDGILRAVSMEATIRELEDITEKGAEQTHFLATDWEPMAIALVAVGADPDAQALAEGETFPCNLLISERTPLKEKAMKVRLLSNDEVVEIAETEFDEKLHSKELEKTATPPVDAKAKQRAVADAIEADLAHAKEIKRLAVHYNLDEVWAQRHVKLGTSIEQVILDATEARARLAPIIDSTIALGEDFESIGWRTDQMAVALAARAARKEPTEAAKQYAKSSIADCALECLALNGRTRGRQLDAKRDPDAVIKLALHTTSDFPLLLGNVLNKTMLPAYELANPTFRRIALQRTFNDFRPHRFMRLGDFPVPLKVDEHGEFKHGTMSEGQEIISLATYGRIFGITRQALINDDVGAFQDLGANAGRRIVDFENTLFFTTCILPAAGLGPVLADALTVYHATHANLIIAGVLSNATLADGIAKMMIQTSIDGLKINAMPTILLVSPASYALARTLVAQITPNQASQVNPFAGQLEVIADANLTGARFYLLAAPGVLPNYVYGTLDGQSGPRVEVRVGFDIDGVETKVAIDYACGSIDYRGGTSGAGA